MKKEKEGDKTLRIAGYAFLFVITFIITLYRPSFFPDGHYFRYFTNLTNIYLGLISLVHLILLVKKKENSRILHVFDFIGAVSIALVFVVVLFFLSIGEGIMTGNFFSLYEDYLFFYHLVNPLLFLYLFFKEKFMVSKKCIVFAVLPMVIYSLVYLFEVVIFKAWPDFYNFTFSGRTYLSPVSLLLAYLCGFISALLLRKGKNKSYEKEIHRTRTD